MQVVGIQGWDVLPCSHTGSKPSSAPACQHSSDLHKGAALPRPPLVTPLSPAQGAQPGPAKPRGSWSCPCWLSSPAGPSWLTSLLGTRGCCWHRQVEAGGCTGGWPEHTHRGLASQHGLLPAPSTHHQCESSTSAPELLPLPKQPGPAQHLLLAVPTAQFPQTPPFWALLLCRLLLSTEQGSLLRVLLPTGLGKPR